MSGNEGSKTQEHRKQRVKVNGAGFTGAYKEGFLYQYLKSHGLMTWSTGWVARR